MLIFAIFDEHMQLLRRYFAFEIVPIELGTLSEEPFAEFQPCTLRFGRFRPG